MTIFFHPNIKQKGALSTVDEAILSARLLRRNMDPWYPMALYANAAALELAQQKTDISSHWDVVQQPSIPTPKDGQAISLALTIRDAGNRSSAYAFKLQALVQSPFTRTLFLDNDIFVLDATLVHGFLSQILMLADVAGPVDPTHAFHRLDRKIQSHTPMLSTCLFAFRNTKQVRGYLLAAWKRFLLGGTDLRGHLYGGRRGFRRGDQEALFLEWTHGKHKLRVLPLPQRNYCPKVTLDAGLLRATWWTGRYQHQPCRALHGHSYHGTIRKYLEKR